MIVGVAGMGVLVAAVSTFASLGGGLAAAGEAPAAFAGVVVAVRGAREPHQYSG